MRKLVAVVVLVLLLWPSVAFASPIGDAIKDLGASGKQSNAYVNHSVIDLVYLTEGTITTYTYLGESEALTLNTFAVDTQSRSSATDKITRFIFELTNRYRPETDLALSVSYPDRETVHAYTYGARKDDAMWAIVYGLQDCLNNPPYDWQSKYDDDDSNDSSYIDKYSPENIATTISTFQINSTTYTINNESKNMDIAPEIKGDRTFVPVRYLAYSLGVPEDGISWEPEKLKVTITKDETSVELLIGQKYQYVNKKPREMDVAPYLKNGRTMLPARWVAEPLGAKVKWDEQTKQIKIEVMKQGQ